MVFPDWLECVVNVSEGRPGPVLDALAGAAGAHLLDLHHDADHNRSVLTLAGPSTEDAARAVARCAVAHLDLRAHRGVHPRFGVVDVVPFVPLGRTPMAEAIAARERFGAWAAEELGLPAFRYGEGAPTLPDTRRLAFRTRSPDWGPPVPHESAGAVAVGARGVLVAYNVWLASTSVDDARRVAASVRSPVLRSLGFDVGGVAQVSMNLVDPHACGPAIAFDAVQLASARLGIGIARAELVGLVPGDVVASIPEPRWPELDLAADRTIEARIAARWGP